MLGREARMAIGLESMRVLGGRLGGQAWRACACSEGGSEGRLGGHARARRAARRAGLEGTLGGRLGGQALFDAGGITGMRGYEDTHAGPFPRHAQNPTHPEGRDPQRGERAHTLGTHLARWIVLGTAQ